VIYSNYRKSDVLVEKKGKIKKYPSFLRDIFKIEWWAHLGLNQGPTGYEPAALTAEL
jgi:hypothetical protein